MGELRSLAITVKRKEEVEIVTDEGTVRVSIEFHDGGQYRMRIQAPDSIDIHRPDKARRPAPRDVTLSAVEALRGRLPSRRPTG